jgi:hypothetical protein
MSAESLATHSHQCGAAQTLTAPRQCRRARYESALAGAGAREDLKFSA